MEEDVVIQTIKVMWRFYSKGSGARATLIGDHSNGTLKIAASRSSESDAFCKTKGVQLAQSRLSKGRHIAEIPMEECDARRFVEIATILSDVVLRTKATSKK